MGPTDLVDIWVHASRWINEVPILASRMPSVPDLTLAGTDPRLIGENARSPSAKFRRFRVWNHNHPTIHGHILLLLVR